MGAIEYWEAKRLTLIDRLRDDRDRAALGGTTVIRKQICSICGVAKPHTSEHFSGEGRKDGRLGIRCRPCKSKKVSESHKRHPETRQRNNVENQQRRSEAGERDLSRLTGDALRRQGGICYYCKTRLSTRSSHGDHKVPVTRGGRTTSRNIVAACSQCNGEKHNKTAAEYRQWRHDTGRVRKRSSRSASC